MTTISSLFFISGITIGSFLIGFILGTNEEAKLKKQRNKIKKKLLKVAVKYLV